MRNLKSLLAIVVSVILLSSCAVHNGFMKNSASLSEANFSYVNQSISGMSSAQYVFVIGGLNRQALVEEAKKDMLKNNPLQPNQVLANVTVNWKYSFYVVVFRTECTVTADVVEFH